MIASDNSPRRTQRPTLAALTLSGAIALAVGAIVASRVENARAVWDQRNFHQLVIEQFARELPRPDLGGYRSVTTPGYHLLLAVVHRYASPDLVVLRCAGATFSAMLAAVLGWAIGERVRLATAVVVGLPFVVSLYVVCSGAWLLPDNLGWLTVLLAILLAFRSRLGSLGYLTAAGVLAAAVFVRQSNLWPWGVLVAAAALGDARSGDGETMTDRLPPGVAPGAGRRVALMLLAGVPAVLILVWFVQLWGGLTPPGFRVPGRLAAGGLPAGSVHTGVNPAVPAMVLGVLGTLGPFFIGFVWHPLRPAREGTWRPGRRLVAGAVVGLLTGLVVPTSFNYDAGRGSGLWNVARVLPVFADRSPLIAVLAAAGGAVVALWFLALGPRDRWIWLAAWVCFIAAQTANAMAWQRYYEPFCLIMLPLAASRVAETHPAPRWAVAGPILLAVLLATVTVWSLRPGG